MIVMEVSRYVYNNLPWHIKNSPCYCWYIVDYATVNQLNAAVDKLTADINSIVITGGGAYKGEYANLAALQAAMPVGQTNWYVQLVDGGNGQAATFYWNDITKKWVNQVITAAAYQQLSEAEKREVPWIIR